MEDLEQAVRLVEDLLKPKFEVNLLLHHLTSVHRCRVNFQACPLQLGDPHLLYQDVDLTLSIYFKNG